MDYVLSYCLPLYVDDLPTLKMYIRVIRVDNHTLALWKRKYIRHVYDKNDKYEVTYDVLPNGLPHGKFTYYEFHQYLWRVRGQYDNGVAVGTFDSGYLNNEWKIVKHVNYVSGTKTYKTLNTSTCYDITLYEDGKKVDRYAILISGLAIHRHIDEVDVLYEYVADNVAHITSCIDGVNYMYMYVDGVANHLIE